MTAHIDIDENNRTFKINGEDISHMIEPDYALTLNGTSKVASVTVTFLADSLTYTPKHGVAVNTGGHTKPHQCTATLNKKTCRCRNAD